MNQLSEYFKTLSDQTRLRIIVLLSCKSLCVCEMCDILKESQPKISRHLAKLRDAGLVIDERHDQWVYYSLNIKDQGILEILGIIVKRLHEYSSLEKDKQRLDLKIRNNDFCIKIK